jgi:hypothetical protein
LIVVVGSAHDPRARSLVAHWGVPCAALLSAEDLSRPGWVLDVPERGRGRCVAGERIIPDRTITGILTLRPRIFAEELGHVAPPDRGYVAAEMTAVLLAWLAARRCPVLNAPSASALAGPNWRAARWRHAAHALGIPVARSERVEDATVTELVMIGSRCFGAVEGRVAAFAAALGRAAGVELLGCRFTPEGEFLSATPWPALDREDIRAALGERLGREA